MREQNTAIQESQPNLQHMVLGMAGCQVFFGFPAQMIRVGYQHIINELPVRERKGIVFAQKIDAVAQHEGAPRHLHIPPNQIGLQIADIFIRLVGVGIPPVFQIGKPQSGKLFVPGFSVTMGKGKEKIQPLDPNMLFKDGSGSKKRMFIYRIPVKFTVL